MRLLFFDQVTWIGWSPNTSHNKFTESPLLADIFLYDTSNLAGSIKYINLTYSIKTLITNNKLYQNRKFEFLPLTWTLTILESPEPIPLIALHKNWPSSWGVLFIIRKEPFSWILRRPSSIGTASNSATSPP